MNSVFITKLERMLGVSFPDNAHASVKKDGTINVRATDALGTRYEVSIKPEGNVLRSRYCSPLARSLNVTEKTAPKGVARSRWSASNCYEYISHETVIKDEKLLGYVRFLIGVHNLFPDFQIP